MTKYLDIPQEEQSILIRKIKENSSETWLSIARKLGVSRSLLFFYRSGEVKISRKNLDKLLLLTKYSVDLNSMSFVEYDNERKHPQFPDFCEDLAEFLGILSGDGHLGKYNYVVGITGNRTSDILHHNYRIQYLFKELFNLTAHTRFQDNAVHTLLGSKDLQEFFIKEFSFPIGEKKGQLIVPSQIYQDDRYKKAFIRGLFDTDGGVHRHHNNSIQVQFTTYDPFFMNQVCDLYREFGFNARINKTDLQLRGKAEIDRFFSEIKPANPKHLYKYKKFKETGVVPLHREIDYSSLNSGLVSFS